jgi:Protein of unknown function (DUF1822)
MSNPHPPSVSLPISSLARHTAQQFADEQVTIHKARRTFLNTLAVWAVHNYLGLMNIATDLAQGDSWNPLMRHYADVADLVMPGIGCLECRPVVGSAVFVYVPPEVWWERIAYIFVQIDGSYTQATLLGFLFRAEQAERSINSLQTMDELLVYLHQVGQYPSILSGKYVLLRDWLDGRYTDNWLDRQELLAQIKPLVFRWQSESVTVRSTIEGSFEGTSRGKFVHLGSYSIPLVMQVEMTTLDRFNLCAQIFPGQDAPFVIEGLTLTILDAGGKIILQTQARDQDGMLQLRFSGSIGEVFQVKLSLGPLWVAKTFMI